MSLDAKKETLSFQTETRQLLDLMIHSLYGNKEIFLRELISNASDAADKLHFEALQNDALYEDDSDLKIRVNFDEKKSTITVSDNGIGMSRAEIIDNIGTIAKSGSREFFESLTGVESQDRQLIGQFGVGFYSAFIVAKEVEVLSRRAGLKHEEGVRWVSDGTGEYSIETISKPQRGTEITLSLRKDAKEFLNDFRLHSIIRKYSDHISLPIIMPKEIEGKQDGEETEGKQDGEETVNSATALWTRNKKEIKEEEYHEFYKHTAHDFDTPLAYLHTQVEGKLEYSSLLFLPSRAPFDLWDRHRQRHGLKLYVRRVFIMDDAEQLLPNYLRFVRGIVDTNDLPLNISREILQDSKIIKSIHNASTKKILNLLKRLATKDNEKYQKFWKEFGRVMKEGTVEETDKGKQKIIADLLRFSSTVDDKEEQLVSLANYVSRMSENQKAIYYITADNFATAKNSPHLEVFRKKGIEVLLLSDPIDEWLATHINEFDDKPLQSVTKGDLDLGETDEDDNKAEQAGTKELLQRIEKILSEHVKEVRITGRLTDSPACLIADGNEIGLNLERILRSAGQEIKGSKPILEINPTHPIILKLNKASDQEFEDWSHILFEQALLSEGGQLKDPALFVRRLNSMFLSLEDR